MASHKFAVGQTLRFSPSLGEDSRRKGRYKVVRQLPEAGNAFQYRIKSETDGHERVVREDQVPEIAPNQDGRLDQETSWSSNRSR
jgi:hypothetical protein